ncbi:hypothetical protein GCM10009776_29350 [Microbacterium deminutum]|uniref:Uncharacterized protein n=1 Tax=Microbacterium deminutum TaxID=344164 RepID=A0ABP5CIS3_9MICO
MERGERSRACLFSSGFEGCSAESAHRSSPPIAECGRVRPATAGCHAVMRPAVDGDGILQESEARVREPAKLRSRFRFVQEDDERTSHIVDAIAVVGARHIEEGMFEDSVVVGHRQEMREREPVR